MIDAGALLDDGKVVVRKLIDDLRSLVDAGDVATSTVVDREYAAAHDAGRTALPFPQWAEGLYALVAVAWVLGGVFVRFCEDNDLVADPLLAGPGNRRAFALDQRSAYLQANPAHDDRHWLREIFRRYRALPATGEIFADHNPVWLLAPSADGARTATQFFQAIDPDTGEVRHDYTDPAWNTRFLGDLYQDLSEHAKKTYALLQTPEFVEEFILDRTLEPAIATFGLREITLIDPTCGSGHFLLGAFHRLVERWRESEPATNTRELARRGLDAIAGVDLNPFAVAIARFRLLVAALRAGGDVRLADAPAYRIHIAVGDSLLRGDPPGRLTGTTIHDEHAAAAAHGYATEDVEDARVLLNRRWHAVVGNPPYITPKDPAVSQLYRARFETCYRSYSLGVPFTERFFQLARQEADSERAGYVGMITANSFMKREFGKKLVEEWVPTHDLTHVIDTSDAHIPGHGTPTVIIFGRNRQPTARTVRAALGIRMEPRVPDEPAKGIVWRSIVELLDHPGSQNEFVSVVDLDRAILEQHPWSIGGGGAAELKTRLDACGMPLSRLIDDVGAGALTREDDVYRVGLGTARRWGIPEQETRLFAVGEDVRDWGIGEPEGVIWPYDETTLKPRASVPTQRFLWRWKPQLVRRVAFGLSQLERGLKWWEYSMFFHNRYRGTRIAYADVATSNHFALHRGNYVFKETAPVLIAKPDVDPYELLAVLNSSVASFWMKQVYHNKGNRAGERWNEQQAFDEFYASDASKLKRLPTHRWSGCGDVARETVEVVGSAAALVASAVGPDRAIRDSGAHQLEQRWLALRKLAISLQERLDWQAYHAYGLIDEDLTTGDAPEPPLHLGERAFEIVLARKMASGEEESTWFSRHRSMPITEVPSHWSPSYQQLVAKRIELIENDVNIGLIERPEYKRRWAAKPWDEQVHDALRSWLLDRLENACYWPEPATLTTTARLAAETRADADFVEVARLHAGRKDVDIAALVAELVKGEAVPYLAAYRYTDAGMRKYAQWLQTWALQRREDAGEEVAVIPAPPRYVKSDFQAGAWEHRGKLDVPKERFISYPNAQREADASLVIGWAGWDHLARARALAAWYVRAKRDGRDIEHLTPLLAGLAELVPWLLQWYDEPNSDAALDRPGSQIAAVVDTELRVLHLTAEDLTEWRPPAKRGRAR